VFQAPILFVLSFGFLWIYLKWAFLSGFVVFVLAFIVNGLLGCLISRVQKDMMAKKDTRMNETNEAIQNIKMLKLYSWQTLYEQRVQ
jgi:hypothetical protein